MEAKYGSKYTSFQKFQAVWHGSGTAQNDAFLNIKRSQHNLFQLVLIYEDFFLKMCFQKYFLAQGKSFNINAIEK